MKRNSSFFACTSADMICEKPVTAAWTIGDKDFLFPSWIFFSAGKVQQAIQFNKCSQHVKRGVSRPCTERIISLRKASLLFFVVQINIIIIKSDLCLFIFTYVRRIKNFSRVTVWNICEYYHLKYCTHAYVNIIWKRINDLLKFFIFL